MTLLPEAVDKANWLVALSNMKVKSWKPQILFIKPI